MLPLVSENFPVVRTLFVCNLTLERSGSSERQRFKNLCKRGTNYQTARERGDRPNADTDVRLDCFSLGLMSLKTFQLEGLKSYV